MSLLLLNSSRLRLNLDFTTGTLDSRITFTRATSATYFNSSGVLSIAASGAARFDYDPVTLAAKGLLIEEARTNRVLHSADFSNAAWVKTNVTVTANNTTGPFGTATADLLTASAANGTVIQDLGVVASAAKTGAVYIKRKTGTGNIDLTMDGGATWTTKAITADWTRIALTQTVADEDFGIRIVTSGDEVWVEAADVQTGAFITSHIPTTTAAVTRNKDEAIMTGAKFSGWYNQAAGTFYIVADRLHTDNCRIVAAEKSASPAADYIWMTFATTARFAATITVASVGQASYAVGSPTATLNTMHKIGFAYTTNDANLIYNGTAATPDTTVSLPTLDQFCIGSENTGNGSHLNGHIKALRYYNYRMPDAELQALTA